MTMPRTSPNSKHHPCMLNRIIIIVKFCTYGTYLFSHGMLHHLGELALADDLYVVVHKNYYLTLGMCYGVVVYGGVVKRRMVL